MKKSNVFKFIFARDYFKDRTAVLLFLTLSALFVLNVGLVLLFVDLTNPIVKTSFSGYGAGTFERGSGFDQYIYGLFAVVSYASVVALSIKTFNIRKSLAILQLYLGIVVMVMLFFVSKALISP